MEEQKEKDFYKDWLDIPEDQRPPNCYQLLGIREFEHDLEVIRKAALKQYAKVKRYQSSRYQKDCVHILREISMAKVVLCNPERKRIYDEKLTQQLPVLDLIVEDEVIDADVWLSFRQEVEAMVRSAGELNEHVRKQIYVEAERKGVLWADVAAIVDELEMAWPRARPKDHASSAAQTNYTIQRERQVPKRLPTLSDGEPPATAANFVHRLVGRVRVSPEVAVVLVLLIIGVFVFYFMISRPALKSELPGISREESRVGEAIKPTESPKEIKNTIGEAIRATAPPKEIKNRIGMELVLISAGEFSMGSEAGDDDERPVHKVRITEPFYMGKYEVTQAEWKAVMGNNPSRFKGDDDLPVENVSWNDCMEFCRRLSEKEGLIYRLPTEAEWEYACRAGTTTRYSFGDDERRLGSYAWYLDNSGRKTDSVGQKTPNAWGLCDMYGNVWEWCADYYDENYYKRSPQKNPNGPDSSSYRVVRGGSWRSDSSFCRAAKRVYFLPGFRDNHCGLRLVRSFLAPAEVSEGRQGAKEMSPEERRRKAEALYTIAKAFLDLEDYDNAIPKLRELIKRFPDSQHRAEVERMLLKAKDVFRKGEEAEENAAGLYGEGEEAFKRQDYETAIAKLRQVPEESAVASKAEALLQKVKTEHAQKLYDAGQKALDEERYSDAVVPFELLIEKYPKSEWVSAAQKGIEKANSILTERIASDAWVTREECKRLEQAGWNSDKTRSLRQIASILRGWTFSRARMELSKDTENLTFEERKVDKAKIYLSDRAAQQIDGNKLYLDGDEWVTAEQLRQDGYIQFGKLWFTPIDLLEQQVVEARANAHKFFAVRRKDMFDSELAKFHGDKVWDKVRKQLSPSRDRRGIISVYGLTTGVRVLSGFTYGVHDFQPGSDNAKWIAAKATVTVSYQLQIPIYKIVGRTVGHENVLEEPWRPIKKPIRKDEWVSMGKIMERVDKTYICLLIREYEAIPRFLKSKHRTGNVYRIPGMQSIYFQNQYFQNHKPKFVIAVIYGPEFDKVFPALKMHMSKVPE